MKKKEQLRCQAKKSIFKKTCLLFVMWSGLLIGNLRAQSVIADNPNVTLQLSNVTLIEFFNKLTEVTGKNFVYSADILELKDLKPGMELTGTVRNVIDFGAFVDIGVHQDGLVHISQICNKYIKHPSEVLKVGDIVKVWVLNADPVKKRIGLTMKEPKQ